MDKSKKRFKGKRLFSVYNEVEEDEPILLTGTAKEISEELNCSTRMVYLSATKGVKIKDKYVCYFIGKECDFE